MDNVVAKIKEYPKDCIYATRDTHTADYLETQEGKFPVSYTHLDVYKRQMVRLQSITLLMKQVQKASSLLHAAIQMAQHHWKHCR